MDTFKNLLLMILVTCGAAAGLLLIASGGDATFEHKGIARVDHSQEDVFEWMRDPELRLQFIAGLSSCKTDAREVEKGATLREVIQDSSGRHDRTVEVLEAEYG